MLAFTKFSLLYCYRRRLPINRESHLYLCGICLGMPHLILVFADYSDVFATHVPPYGCFMLP
ncbi:ribonucleoside-diphosphate reductase 1 subunit beta [Bacillus phage BSTP3]|nr:ribonucleoside-diphosphate reductase 1 subunit beta [Bacillus phage BSTP3]